MADWLQSCDAVKSAAGTCGESRSRAAQQLRALRSCNICQSSSLKEETLIRSKTNKQKLGFVEEYCQDILYSQGPSVFAQVTLLMQVSHICKQKLRKFQFLKTHMTKRDFNIGYNIDCNYHSIAIKDLWKIIIIFSCWLCAVHMGPWQHARQCNGSKQKLKESIRQHVAIDNRQTRKVQFPAFWWEPTYHIY